MSRHPLPVDTALLSCLKVVEWMWRQCRPTKRPRFVLEGGVVPTFDGILLGIYIPSSGAKGP